MQQTRLEESIGFGEILTGVHSCHGPLHLHTRTNVPLAPSPCACSTRSLLRCLFGGVGVPYGSSEKWKWSGDRQFSGSDFGIYVVSAFVFLSFSLFWYFFRSSLHSGICHRSIFCSVFVAILKFVVFCRASGCCRL